MTISPIQPLRGDYVTKGEFNTHESYVKEGFEKTFKQIDEVEKSMNKRFDEQKKYMNTGFGKLGEQIDAVESNIGNKIDSLTKTVNKIAAVLKV